jgi:hypothetical protein
MNPQRTGQVTSRKRGFPAMHPALAVLAATVLLAACGGGGGDAGPGASTPPPPAPAPAPAPTPAPTITVTAMTEPTFTSADCSRLQSDDVALAALNLADPQINQLNTVIRDVDPDFGWRMFIRAPETFIKWAITANPSTKRLDAHSVGIATHETHHEIGFAITDLCPIAFDYKITWENTTYATGLTFGETPRYNIVDTVLPANLKSSSRYSLYILDLGNYSGNNFNMLMDELAAYVAGAVSEYRWSSKRGDPNNSYIDTNLAGMVEFMAWTQAYLQAVRQSDPVAWNRIRTDVQAIEALKKVWARAETTLEQAYAQTRPGTNPRLAYDPLVFDYVYQADPLNELSQLGITTRARNSWVGSYL